MTAACSNCAGNRCLDSFDGIGSGSGYGEAHKPFRLRGSNSMILPKSAGMRLPGQDDSNSSVILLAILQVNDIGDGVLDFS